MKLAIAGGSGFLGTALARYFGSRDHEIIILTRRPKVRKDRVREVEWDGETIGAWTRELQGAAALINLAGVSVNCRYHARNRARILDSRVNTTHVLGQAISRMAHPPLVWLNASTATIYRHTFGPAWTESGEIGSHPDARDAFSIEAATAWERAFNEAPATTTRKVVLRSALVLGHGNNSVFPVLRRLTRLGLGGRMGSGRQFVSWIHELDFCRAVEFLIEHDEISGVVNLAAPNPLRNKDMMQTLRQVCGASCGLPTPEWLLELGAFLFRTETELVVKSRRVVPRRLLDHHFQFQFTHIRDAFANLDGMQEQAGVPSQGTPPQTEARTDPSHQALIRLSSVRWEPLLVADWSRVLMLHLEADPARLQTSVPFTLDLLGGRAFVTLVAFTLRGLRPRFGGRLSRRLFRPIATHEFFNVRTYVRIGEEPGIHFLAEWLSNRLAVRLGPSTFALPYRHADIAYKHDWTAQRLQGQIEDGKAGHGICYTAVVPPNPDFISCAPGSREEWLMERYSAFNCVRGRKRLFRVWHRPWTQCPAEAHLTDISLLVDNWPWLREATLVGANFSPGLNNVWMGRPHRLRTEA